MSTQINDIDKMLENISKNINNKRLERGLSFEQMSDLCHVPESTIRNIIYGKSKNHGIVTLQGLGIKIVDLFK